MFFPLKDENPTYNKPVITFGIITLCVLFWMYELAVDVGPAVYQFGLIPALLLGKGVATFDAAPPVMTLFTHMFLHGGWMHLIGNLLFLWVFGNNIEDVLGKFRYILFYVLSGLGAAALQIITDPGSGIPMVGASGAISGVMGAYIILYPRVRVVTLIFFGIITVARIQAVWLLGIWIVYQVIFAFLNFGADGGGTAWFAHIGGFIVGAALIFVLKPGEKPTLDFNQYKLHKPYKPNQPQRPVEREDDYPKGPWG